MKTFRFRTAKPAAFDVISLEEARSWLNMDIPGVTFADETIKSLVKGAVAYVEKKLNYSLGISTYKWNAGCFPRELPDSFYVKSIVAVRRTVDGVLEDISPANYSLVRLGERRTEIRWVSTYEGQRPPYYTPYEVEFTAGVAPQDIDEDIKMAIRVIVSDRYENRNDTVSEKRTFADKILNNHIIPYA